MSTYPRRPAYYSHRFVRLLTKTAAAQELGCDTCWLLTVIAHQEDAKKYKGAVTFYNEQLMPLCGFGGRRRLVEARQRAIGAGWLHYQEGGKSVPGKYWTLIPPHLADLPDAPIDEDSDGFSRSELERQTVCRSKMEHQVERQADSKWNDKCAPFYPVPDPKEESAPLDGQQNVKTARFVAPTIDDVRAYCLERGNQIDPAAFIDFYQSKGWRVGSQPMKDWRAAVRTWERREARDGKPAESIYKELRLPT